MISIWFFSILCGLSCAYERVLQDYLRWNYTHMNPSCTGAGGSVNPCMDIRVCDFAAASIALGGWPTLCGWVGDNVPRVCCGVPLVFGETLMKKIDEENARKRECGTVIHSPGLSETENKFFEIKNSLPPLDKSNPNKFDPPLDLKDSKGPSVLPVGGVSSRQGDFPWMVSIRKAGVHWCGGSLIDRNHILSAAHCFVSGREKPDPTMYMVHVGNIHIDKGQPYAVKKIVVHEGYIPGKFYNDIAILTLHEELLHPMIAHICLPSPRITSMSLVGKNTTLLGWGDATFGGRGTSVLHIVEGLPVVSNEECQKRYKSKIVNVLPHGITDEFICAGLPEGGKDACQSDSGGPLMLKDNDKNLRDFHPSIPYSLVGIVSSGYSCGEPGYPGIYTRVSSFIDWIKNKT
ncbi:trypsin-1 isoform X2 [Parasteatoda tepidariorum]|uniref:trypsin-1 isoform X2 n=1 Tax=Parasteatoda tepidariorum TaxID=114398 RepID=UPI001C7193BF|nr:clotting factor B isoform X2 [Parasteatoda tepidariorum]